MHPRHAKAVFRRLVRNKFQNDPNGRMLAGPVGTPGADPASSRDRIKRRGRYAVAMSTLVIVLIAAAVIGVVIVLAIFMSDR